MHGLFTIYRRELAGLFLSPLAWLLLCGALLVNGLFFYFVYLPATALAQGQGVLVDVQSALLFSLGSRGWPSFWTITVVLPPLLTMRMISEEARTGLVEFLLTAPVSDLAVVLGKLLAATTLMGALWSSVLAYGLTAQALGASPDWIPIVSCVVGATLVAALFCAIGLSTSAATNTPLLAAFFAFLLGLAFVVVPLLAPTLGLPRGHWLQKTLGHMDSINQFSASFGSGVLDSKHAVFFVAWTAFFVFLAARLLEARRWR